MTTRILNRRVQFDERSCPRHPAQRQHLALTRIADMRYLLTFIAGGVIVQMHHMGWLKIASDWSIAKFKTWRGTP